MRGGRGFAVIPLLIIIAALATVVGLGWLVFNPGQRLPWPGKGNAVACTQEAKLCPDGSYVGRVPPKCEFAPCPSTEGWKSYTNSEHGFSFKYDPQWNARRINEPGDERIFELSPKVKPGEPITIGVDELTIVISSKTIDELTTNTVLDFPRAFSDTTVGGKPAKISSVIQGIESQFREVFVDLGGKTLVITAGGKHMGALEMTLSTFIFMK